MSNSRLLLTDGTTRIDLLNLSGWLLKDWQPSVPEPKGGGVFRSSPLTDGRRLVSRVFDNTVDTFTLVGGKSSQDSLIESIQELERLLEKATAYWTTRWQNEPVWMEAQGSCESETRYAAVVDYRLTGFGNPYKQPFFNADDHTATEAILAIEHLHWQETRPGAAGTCVQVSAAQYFGEVSTLTTINVFPAANSDDVEAQPENKLVQLTDADIFLGFFNSVDFNAGILFDNVTIPVGATIVSAYVELTASINAGTDQMDIVIEAQDPDSGAVSTFSGTWSDWANRKRLSSIVQTIWTTPVWVLNTIYTTCELKELIQSVVDATAWASGNDIVLFFQPRLSGDTELRRFYAYDHASGAPAKLVITYSSTSGTQLGRTATCSNEVYVTNKHNVAPISHIYFYDVDGDPNPFSANLIGDTTYPNALLPAIPAVGDFIYFISNTAIPNSGPFNSIVFDLAAAQTGITDIDWKYWNGAWTALAPGNTGVMCGNWLLDTAGVSSVTFQQPGDWTTTTINGITGYIVRAEVVSISGVPTPPTQQNRDIYTVVLPYVDIDSAQVKGDIPALARIIFDSATCYGAYTTTLHMGLRSLSRGADFSAYLNVSDEQNPAGITFGVLDGGIGTFSTATEAPTGRNIDGSSFVHTTLAEVGHWTFSPEVALQYPGTYHAYLRVKQTSGSAGAVKFRLRSVFGSGFNVYYSETVVTPAITAIVSLDMGQFIIQAPGALTANDTPTQMRIILDAANDAGENFEVYDLILIPVDEWAGSFSSTPTGADTVRFYEGKRVEIDSITNLRQYRAFLETIVTDTTQTIDAELYRPVSARPFLQSNADQRLWFYQTSGTNPNSYFESIGKVRLQRSNRYLLMRGDR